MMHEVHEEYEDFNIDIGGVSCTTCDEYVCAINCTLDVIIKACDEHMCEA